MKTKTSLSHRSIEPENGVLYLVGTPIGNLADISQRALNILEKVFFIACEDTRHTKRIMNTYKISNKMESFNSYNSFKKIPKIVDLLEDGKSIALVSDAGMPGICDPGEELVRRTILTGHEVICIPGPCAAITALVSSGLPSSKFIFEGFLPKKKIEREKILLEISKCEKTTIIYESPHKINKLLKELKEYCGGSRRIRVARELTKKFEEHIGQNADELIEFFNNNEAKGEFTILVGGNLDKKNSTINNLILKDELHELVGLGLTLSSASKYLAKKNNLSKRYIYNLY